MDKQKYLVTYEGGGSVVLAEDEESAIDYIVEHPVPEATEDYLMNAEVEKVTGPVYRVKAEIQIRGMGGPIHEEFVLMAANPEEAAEGARGHTTMFSWQGATILSVEEVQEVLEA